MPASDDAGTQTIHNTKNNPFLSDYMDVVAMPSSPGQFERILIVLIALMIVASTIACTDYIVRSRAVRKSNGDIVDTPDELDQIFVDIVRRARDEAGQEREDEEPIPPAADYQNLSETEQARGRGVWNELLK